MPSRCSVMFLAVLVAAVGACGDISVGDAETMAGSGNQMVESRDVAEFDEVVLAGEGAVSITFGETESLTIEVDDNLLEHIQSTVENGRLVIRTEPGIDIEPSQTPSYRVGVRELTGLELSGVGSIHVGEWQATNAWVTMRGVGEISVEQLDAENLTAEMSGVGAIVLVGTVGNQKVMVDGVGEYRGGDLQSRTGDVWAGGNGLVRVWATDQLFVTADGLGKVEYYGPAEVLPQIDGLATLGYLGDK